MRRRGSPPSTRLGSSSRPLVSGRGYGLGAFVPQGLALLLFSATLGLFSVLLTWHSELPLNNAGPKSDATRAQALLSWGGDAAGAGMPWSASDSSQCQGPHRRLWGPWRRKSKVCSSPASPLQPGEELASHSEGNDLSTKPVLSSTIQATHLPSPDPAQGHKDAAWVLNSPSPSPSFDSQGH